MTGGAGEASAADCVFTGPGTNWHAGTNWTCGHPPTGDDNAFIGSGDGVTVDATAVADLLFQSGGTITFSDDSNLAVDSYTAGADGVASRIEGAGSLTVAGTFTKGGDSTFFVGNSAAGTSPDLVLDGAATLNEGAMCVGTNNSSLTDNPSLQINDTFTIVDGAAAAAFNCTSGPRIHINAPDGHLVKAAAATMTFGTMVDNDDQLTVQNGELILEGGTGGQTSDGAYVAGAGATLQFGGCCAENFQIGATGRVGGPGTIEMSANPMTVAAGATFDPAVLDLQFGVLELNGTSPVSLPVLTQSSTLDTDRPVVSGSWSVKGGMLAGTATHTIAPDASFTKTTAGTFFIGGDTDLILNEDVTLAGGSICLNSSGVDDAHLFINETFTIPAGAAPVAFSCTSGLRVHISSTGHLVKTAAGTTTFGTMVDNDGRITVQAGELVLQGGTGGQASDGAYVADAGATIQFGGCCAEDFQIGAAGRVGGAGTIEMSANPMTLAAGATFDPAHLDLLFASVVLNGTAPLTLPDVSITNSASLDTDRAVTATKLDVIGSGSIRGTGSVTVPAGGSFTKTGSGSFSVTANGGEAAADLILNVDATLAGGSVCVARSDGSHPDEPSLQINQDFVIGAGADPVWHTCSSQALVHVNGPSGTLSREGAGTSSSNGGIEIAGGGVTVATGQTLSFAIAYQQTGGTTTLQAGGALAANVALTGGTLRGSGQITGNLTNTSGTVSPGTSPGTLTVTGAYAQGAGGTLEVGVDGAAQGTEYDRLAVTGAATLSGTVAVVPGLGFDPALSDTFQFLTSASRTGTFGTLTGAALPDCKRYTLDYPGAPDFGARLEVEQVSPCLSIDDDVTAQEGNNGGTKAFEFTVSLDQPAPPGGVSVDFATDDGTAIAPGDYASSSGTLDFAEGETTEPITVQVNRDNSLEPAETFFVDLSNPTAGAAIADGQGLGTIQNDDAPPVVTIDDVSAPEGNFAGGGPTATPFRFTVALGQPAGQGGASVDFATAGETATQGSDYTGRSGRLNFAEGEQQKEVAVSVLMDSTPEPDETFVVNLSNPTNAAILDGVGRGTIRNDDSGPPEISIDDVSHEEGNSGTTPFTFTVSLSHPAQAGTVSVRYQTVDGSAREPSDYTGSGPVALALTFAAGETEKQVTIDVNGDVQEEPNETFSVQLSSPNGGTIADGQGTGRILNDDGPGPGIEILDVTQQEGTGGNGTFFFSVTHDGQAPAGGIEFDYSTVDGTAKAGSDYVAESGHVSVPEGQFAPQIRVEVVSDSRFEPDEAFAIRLSNARGAPLADGDARATIQDDDFGVSVGDVSKDEGDSGTKTFNFTVSLNRPANGTRRVDFDTADAKAKAPGDYGAKSGTVVFTQGQQTQQVPIQVKGDRTEEPEESFIVKLVNARGSLAIADNRGTGTIRDDDAPPRISVSGPGRVPEGDSGTTEFPFEVSLSRPAPAGGVQVDFEAAEMPRGVTAEKGSDFQPKSGRLTIAPGLQEKTVRVLVSGDTAFEPNERFQLELSDAARATIDDSTGIATIDNDDDPRPPDIHINDLSTQEGDTGTHELTFIVSLTRAAPAGGVTATYHAVTAGGSLTAEDDDIVAEQGDIAFAQGETQKQVTIGIVGDTVREDDETFNVNLGNVHGAGTLGAGASTGRGTIVNDD
jgi:hypothetical protein